MNSFIQSNHKHGYFDVGSPEFKYNIFRNGRGCKLYTCEYVYFEFHYIIL